MFQRPVHPALFPHHRDRLPDQDGRPTRALGELITDRPINENVADFTYGIGITPTLIDEERSFEAGGSFLADYVPLLRP